MTWVSSRAAVDGDRGAAQCRVDGKRDAWVERVTIRARLSDDVCGRGGRYRTADL